MITNVFKRVARKTEKANEKAHKGRNRSSF